MPGFDKTGPQGQGPMTGRRMGRCSGRIKDTKETENTASGKEKTDSSESLPGRGMGRGRRGGAGKGKGQGQGQGRGQGRGQGTGQGRSQGR
jgi:hypothetical protein